MLTRPQCPSRCYRYSDGPSGCSCPIICIGEYSPYTQHWTDLLPSRGVPPTVIVTRAPLNWSHRLSCEASSRVEAMTGGNPTEDIQETYRLVIDLRWLAEWWQMRTCASAYAIRLPRTDEPFSHPRENHSHPLAFAPASAPTNEAETGGLAEAPSRADFRLA
jgi:hypothetical protein